MRIGVEARRGVRQPTRSSRRSASARAAARPSPRCSAQRLGDLARRSCAAGSAPSSAPGTPSPMRSPRSAHRARRRAPISSRAVEADAAADARRRRAADPSRRARSSTCRSPISPISPTRLAAREREARRRAAPRRGRARCRPDAQVARPRAAASSAPPLTRAREPRVEQVAQAVAHQVQAEHREHDREARPDGAAATTGTSCVCASLSIRPQLGVRRLGAEAEIADSAASARIATANWIVACTISDRGDVRQHVVERDAPARPCRRRARRARTRATRRRCAAARVMRANTGMLKMPIATIDVTRPGP